MKILRNFEKSATGKLTQKGRDQLISEITNEVNAGLTVPLTELQQILIDLVVTKAIIKLDNQ